jgi:hypothetical protein
MATITIKHFCYVQSRLQSRGIEINSQDLRALILASRGLGRWFEQECGQSNNCASWGIDRDPETGRPERVLHWREGNTTRYQIRDMERTYRSRVENICKDLGLRYYIQSDPRGASLYISSAPIGPSDYTNGVAIF